MMVNLLPYDDAAWEESEKGADAWLGSLHDQERYLAITKFLLSYRPGKPTQLTTIVGGSNVSFRLTYRENSSVVLRMPIPFLSIFPEEKLQYEIATMQCLKDNTTLPLPRILGYGPAAANPLQLGPFLILEYIDHETDLGTLLNTPNVSQDVRPVLDPNINLPILERAYDQFSDILLQLSRVTFWRIGSLILQETVDGSQRIGARPLPIHWNELVRLGAFPRSELSSSSTTFPTAASYLTELADMHIKHLLHQPHDSITSESDCRQKFLARLLFRKLARQGRLLPASTDKGPFKLWCDDLRPDSVLLNINHDVVGVIDWEYSYAAPLEFSCTPPWWLLLETPEKWSEGLESWTRKFDERLKVFLSLLRRREDRLIEEGTFREEDRLSGPMTKSWETGQFWVIYAAQRNFAFDLVFRQKLDRIFLGPQLNWDSDWEDRVGLLSKKERLELDELVRCKLEKDSH
ncbi:phosphotransferase family protein [Aspergillus coremiiformis]|uniref:Phosphotransferase family protein n=1 Tax=Aspergillus coremiiformis TaxID=138285 RepID=A0A5N6Z439_9EURO|nr:phosphotransferase family protein [Aspergillus coremiiformis]